MRTNNADELGRVKITSGKVAEDDTITVGNIDTESITGKNFNALATGTFAATGDIIAHDGRIRIIALDDISTKKVEALNKFISLISSQGGITVDGDLFSGDKEISVVAANDISTQKIESTNGVVVLSSYNGEVTIEDEITTVNGGVVISAKEDISFANITTETGEVNIGSAKGNITASGNISTNTGYVDLKTSGNIALQNVTTSKGYIDIASNQSLATQNLTTDNGVISLASIQSDIAVNGDINTDGSYVDLEAGLEITRNEINTGDGGVDIASYSDFGVGVLIASADGSIDISPTDVENYSSLTEEQQESINEVLIDFVEEVFYTVRPAGEFALGVVAQWLLDQGADVRAILEFSFPN